jgi:AcrR family transcriptional regulator
MGIAERKEREKQERRAMILSAATKMFLEEGYEKTSLRAIADRIEYSPATIYLYFKDKTELLEAVMEQGFEVLMKYLERSLEYQHPLDRLRAMASEYIRFAHEHPSYYDLMFIMNAPMEHVEGPEDWDCGFQAFGLLVQVVMECINQKLIRFDDPVKAALTYWSILHGMVSLKVRDRLIVFPQEPLSHDELIHETAYNLIRLLAV